MNSMILRSRLALPFATLALIALGACDSPTDPRASSPREIEIIAPAHGNVTSLGDVVEFKARVRDEWGKELSGQALVWVSSDTLILEPAGAGLFRSVRNGEATVTVSLDPEAHIDASGYRAGIATATSRIVVRQRPATITLGVANSSFWALGQTQPLHVRVFDANGHDLESPYTAVWSVADPAVVAVDTAGVATALRDGETGVTVRVEDVTASAALSVNATIPFRACITFRQQVETVCATSSVVARVKQ